MLLSKRLHGILSAPDHAHIGKMMRGLEKESLRVSTEGILARTNHPAALGSALTHSGITTDYSEALLEFITPPTQDIDELITQLSDLHRFTYQNIGDESLWVNSMPCMLAQDRDIPVALYGDSNSGKMKTAYRMGLGHRYGRAMQTIAGIHYNFSVADEFWEFLRHQEQSPLGLEDYKTQGYFRLIRNFRRYFWLLLYLFGAAPAVCRTFVKGRDHQLVKVGKDNHSLHTPYATSLRMGNLGYQSSAQDTLKLTYNCLDTYTNTLCRAITEKYPAYQQVGVKDKKGNYQQLNEGLLQIENEFYSVIRPKRTAKRGQTALNALNSGGVEYIEVRCLDLNPYTPLGIHKEQIHFLDTFLLYCLLEESPFSDEAEYEQIQTNQHRMVYEGRDPDLSLYYFGKERPARDWGREIISKLKPLADMLDTTSNKGCYNDTLSKQLLKLNDDSLTPSAKVIADMKEQEVTFFRLAMNAAISNKEHFLAQGMSDEETAYFNKLAKESLTKQKAIEASDTMSFDEFLSAYYEQYQCQSPTTKERRHR